jgi:hypothetical protein
MTVYMIARMEITDPERYKDTLGRKSPRLIAAAVEGETDLVRAKAEIRFCMSEVWD